MREPFGAKMAHKMQSKYHILRKKKNKNKIKYNIYFDKAAAEKAHSGTEYVRKCVCVWC